ncbi:hypothetical protein HPB47_017169 [Ixodes persulcatus]|uniref:Uncharacterized protein n=1 Tax=Ixodes persulcatus TaxID=34615 RepID=A0AC60QP96_IXOPE|nr:hypothetical protein HPB47_017169 [Ixodes persulcatus]
MRVCRAHFAKEDFLWNTTVNATLSPYRVELKCKHALLSLKRLKQGTMPSMRLPVRVHDRPAPMPKVDDVTERQRVHLVHPLNGKLEAACVERSLVLSTLQPFRDNVMVDKGFHVDAECNKLGLGVVQPPFLRQQQRFSVADAMKTVSQDLEWNLSDCASLQVDTCGISMSTLEKQQSMNAKCPELKHQNLTSRPKLCLRFRKISSAKVISCT